MRRAILVAALLLGCSGTAFAQDASAPPDMIKTCESCHGPGGNGTTASTPRLNGQLSAYLVNRLKELTDLTRNSYAATMAMHDTARMQDSLKAAVSDYFSRQPPTAAAPQAGRSAAMGKKVYEVGDPAINLPSCQSCHGASAEGLGNAPRLAGQHRDYLKTQLWNFNFVQRENAAMHPNALRLSADQIDGLVAYLGAD